MKSKDGGDPLIVKPLGKKSDLFQCVCSTYRALEICPDTVAVADDQGIPFEYLYALRQKLSKKISKSIAGVNLTAAIETGLRVSEKGLEQNEVRNATRRKQKSKVFVKCTYPATPSQRPVLPSRPDAMEIHGSNENTNKHRPGDRHVRITSKCNIHSMGSQLHKDF